MQWWCAAQGVPWRWAWQAYPGVWLFALALVGAPYTQSQIGHLNQLPPPFVLIALAGTMAAVRGHDPPRGGVQVAGAGVVAQPGPQVQDLVLAGRGQ